MRILGPEITADSLRVNPFEKRFQEEFEGDIFLGMLPEGIQLIVPRLLFVRHWLSCGATGYGKTLQFFHLMCEFQKKGIRFIAFDTIKRDVRHTIRHMNKLLVLRTGDKTNFQYNPFRIPKGVSQIDWDTTLIRIFGENQFILEGGEGIYFKIVTDLRQRGQPVTADSIYQSLLQLRFKSFRELNWRASMLNRFGAMRIILGKTVNYNEGIKIEELSDDFDLCFEFDTAGVFRSFLASSIIAGICKNRIAVNRRGDYLQNAIFCDEGNLLMGKQVERNAIQMGISPMFLMLIQTGREFGLGFIISTNQPTYLSDTVKVNVSTKVLMNLGDWNETFNIARSMNLSKEQTEFSSNMPPGMGIVKKEGIPPFLVQFPYLKIEKNVTDEEIEEKNKKVLEEAGMDISVLTPENKTDTVKQEISGHPSTIESQADKNITEDELAFLWDIHNHPYISLTERIKGAKS